MVGGRVSDVFGEEVLGIGVEVDIGFVLFGLVVVGYVV